MSDVPRTRTIRSPRAQELQGSRAGFLSRCVADLIDLAVVVLFYFLALLIVAGVKYFVLGDDFDVPQPNFGITTIASWVIAVIYLSGGWANAGRTFGKSTRGLRVVSSRGRPLSPRHAFFRALICSTLLWVALIPIPFSRSRSGIHDYVLRTAVVYDWTTHT
jgi:uncharacterized RDD family membrane protein YckC